MSGGECTGGAREMYRNSIVQLQEQDAHEAMLLRSATPRNCAVSPNVAPGYSLRSELYRIFSFSKDMT